MIDEHALADLERLSDILRTTGPVAVAVSGGIDSLTLAFAAHRCREGDAVMFHAVSPAVPQSSTERVVRYSEVEGWHLEIINAGEFDDERYLQNPVNRCFYCKDNLYASIAGRTEDERQLLSGTNLDDLDDWRPGLKAAEVYCVRHPFVEAKINKAAVRAIARHYQMNDVAELPASPCLSSRVETGLPIVPRELAFVDLAERYIQKELTPATVRCRIRQARIVIELDIETYGRVIQHKRKALACELSKLYSLQGIQNEYAVEFAPYEQGSAFLRSPR